MNITYVINLYCALSIREAVVAIYDYTVQVKEDTIVSLQMCGNCGRSLDIRADR